jgi:hypothetical protein
MRIRVDLIKPSTCENCGSNSVSYLMLDCNSQSVYMQSIMMMVWWMYLFLETFWNELIIKYSFNNYFKLFWSSTRALGAPPYNVNNFYKFFHNWASNLVSSFPSNEMDDRAITMYNYSVEMPRIRCDLNN